MFPGDTIVAISSAIGPAARMIIRASGSQALSLAAQLGAISTGKGATARREILRCRGVGVPSWIYAFVSPHSYTGEDLAEFHVPGNPVLGRMLLDELLRLGTRQAEAGEFTARAFFNGRLDLTAAEGIAATIAATGAMELAAARQLLSGELARRLTPIMELLLETLALVEVGIDFSEEDLTVLANDAIISRIGQVVESLDRLLKESGRFERLTHEPRVVLVGRPNAGKSTLLNALAGSNRAIVSPLAGTTRDALRAEVALPRGMIRLIDVAGLDKEVVPSDVIDGKMRCQALRAVEEADVVLLVEDCSDPRARLSLPREAQLIIRSKADLYDGSTFGHEDGLSIPTIAVSALNGMNLNGLRQHLDRICFGESSASAALLLNLRHVHAIEEARGALERVVNPPSSPRAELIALDLREAVEALGAVLGRVTPDDLLGRIFSGFRIRK